MSVDRKVKEAVSLQIEQIGTLFDPDAKITVLVRLPNEPGFALTMTNDEMMASMLAFYSSQN